jgi:3-oxoadipate enol-lactonase
MESAEHMMTTLLNNDGLPAHIVVRDGTRIAYRLHGRHDSDTRVVLLHSLAMDGNFWQPVIERLGPDVAVLAIDCRGHGASDKPAGPYTVERFAEDVHDVCGVLHFRNVLVAGASMGGCVALQFAGAFPLSTRAVGLIDTTAWYGETAPADWNARAAKAESEGLAALVQFQATRWFSDAFRAERIDILDQCVTTFLRNDIQAFMASCRMLGAFDGRALLDRIKVPTAVLVGEEDYAAPPAMARALHEGISGSTLTVIPQARHLTPLETPDIVADALRRLLDQTARA